MPREHAMFAAETRDLNQETRALSALTMIFRYFARMFYPLQFDTNQIYSSVGKVPKHPTDSKEASVRG